MNKYLLDTDICISLIKHNKNVLSKILEVGRENCFVSEITVAELFYGAAKSGRDEHYKDVSLIQKLFTVIPIFPCLKLYGETRFKLEKDSNKLDNFDLLIGCTSVYDKMIMVTGNTRHYQRIDDIKLENWM